MELPFFPQNRKRRNHNLPMKILWYALFKGELCRIRKDTAGSLFCEVWRKGVWSKGPDFAEENFNGRALSREEAQEWMRSCFKEKKV